MTFPINKKGLKIALILVLVVFGSLGLSNLIVQAQGGDPTIAGAGDISPRSNGAQFQTAATVRWINPTAVLVFGDNQYPDGLLADYNAYYDRSWGVGTSGQTNLKAITHPVPGNHEYHTAGAAGYFDYFNGVGVNTGPAGERGKGYYSYNLGSWHLIALNSESDTGATGAQVQWLANDLNANQNKTCTLAYWHNPRFSSATHGSNARTAPFWDKLYQYAADIVLVGHDHVYERFAPQSPSAVSEPTRGIREIIVGTGGAGLYSFGTPIANSQVRILQHGVIKLTLHSNSYDWQFLGTANQVLDSGSGNCVTGAAVTSTPTPTGPTQTPTPRPSVTVTQTVTPTPTPGQGAILSLLPATQTKSVNQTGTLNAFVDPRGSNVASMELVINFNPNLVRVDNITPGPFFTDPGIGTPVEVTKTIDNTAGRIHYALGFPLGSNYSSTAAKNAAMISFTTRNLSGTSQVSFVTTGTPRTQVANINGVNVLSSTTNAAITISGGPTVTLTPTPRPSATLTPTPRPTSTLTPTPTLIPGQGAGLSLTPASQSLGINTSGNLNVFVNPNGEQVASMELVITYNPNLIRVDNITPGPFFTDPGIGTPVEVTKTIDNTAGRIHYALGFPLGSNYSSTAAKNAVLISFTTRGTSGTAQVSFVTTGNPKTQVADISGANVLGTTSGATITVGTGATSTPTSTLSITPTPTPGEIWTYEGCLETGGRTGRGDDDDDDDDDRSSNSRNSNRWRNIPFPAQTGRFTAEFDATPTSTRSSRTSSLYVGLSKGAANDFTDLAAIIEFAADGNIKARNGNRYTATRQVAYRLGRTYHIRLVVDVPNHTYSAYVKPPSGRERQIANNYKFRTEQRRVTSLNNLGFYARTRVRKLKICDLKITPLTGGQPTVTSGPTPTLPPNVTPTATLSPTPTPTPGITITPTPGPTSPPGSGTPTPTPIPCTPTNGDADGDGDADINDYNIWLAHYNQSTSNGPSDGDFNCSGFVDGVDYSIWLAAQPSPTPTPTPSGPTPTTGGNLYLNNSVCNPDLGSAAFTTNITNQYLPFSTGYQNDHVLFNSSNNERVRMRILTGTKSIPGADGVDPVQTIILEEYETINGVLVEISRNWFAQTVGGNLPGTVCYFGEDVDKYAPDGTISGHGGSWEAGNPAQARAGIMMPPPSYLTVGRNWLIEDAACCGAYENGVVQTTGLTFTTPAGTFNNVIYILEADGASNKRYAPGVGMISDEGMLLISY